MINNEILERIRLGLIGLAKVFVFLLESLLKVMRKQ